LPPQGQAVNPGRVARRRGDPLGLACMTTYPEPQDPAWTGESLGGKQAATVETGRDFIAALDSAAARLRGRAFPDIGKDDAAHPAIAAAMAAVAHQLHRGRGFALIEGPDPARYDLEDYARLFWALGSHLGRGAVQSQFGDHVSRVERNPDLPWRGTTTDMELRPHTDFHEIMALASVSLAPEGGVSGSVSSRHVHDVLAAERPDLLEALYEGWYHTAPAKGEAPSGKVPIFCEREGLVSCFHNRVFFQKPEDAGEPMHEALMQAIAAMDAIANRPGVAARFMLEAGEMAFWHNFRVMHARTAFRDSEMQKRLLLRLWLHAHEARPMAEAIRERGYVMDRVHARGPAAVEAWPGAPYR